MSVIIFGSINMDLVVRSPRLPEPGETLIGHSFETVPGGKGANQAVAVARLGIQTALIGRIGNDGFGQTLLQGLESDGITCDRVLHDASTHSGVAMIAVDDASENNIIVIPGANGNVGEADVDRLRAALPQAQVLLLQLEIPLPAVLAAAQAAKDAGVTVILDPAPARSDLPDSLYPLIDILTPNQVEARQLAGFPVNDIETAHRAAIVLRQRGVKTVIVKLGKLGALCVTESETFQIPIFPVRAVDTVAAGDAFNGGLAAGLAADLPLSQAATQAAAVAALSVTKPGAQPSLPTRAELEAFLAQRETPSTPAD
ncbi:ribokinase [Leptolyngbya ohadii]|uniref:ribokinase n=1 Tax=Leptolyngbya ohadii TaxID=1962290 RepID=UPI000B5A19BA|nr:ribokinase [Leptolyngbya ohadii]